MLIFSRRVSALLVALFLPTLLTAQEDALVGVWELWVESGYEHRPAYGTHAIENAGDGLAVFVVAGDDSSDAHVL